MNVDQESQRPVRQRLPHDTPARVVPSGEIFFITICCAERGINSLAVDEVAIPLMETVDFRNQQGIWWCSSLVVMPDHVHGLFRFPNASGDLTMQKVMRCWKGWTARTCRIRWQRDWFDHRLRSGESDRETARYIQNNPVRAGLVRDGDEWPYYFVTDPVD